MRRTFTLLVVLLAAAGAGHQQTLPPAAAWTRPAATASHSYLWVEGFAGAGYFIAEYALDGGIAHPVILTTSQIWPGDPAFDAAGNVYLAVRGGPYDLGLIAVYGPTSTRKPKRTFAQGVAVGRPYDLRCDAAGNLYVANTDPMRGKHLQFYGEVDVYGPGKTTPSRTITTGTDFPEYLTFDRSGKLYVSNLESKAVAVYSAGKKPVRVFKLKDSIVAPGHRRRARSSTERSLKWIARRATAADDSRPRPAVCDRNTEALG